MFCVYCAMEHREYTKQSVETMKVFYWLTHDSFYRRFIDLNNFQKTIHFNIFEST